MKLQERMIRSIRRRTGNVFLRTEFSGLGSATQVSAALKALADAGVITRIGKGVYARTRKSSVTGKTVPAGSLETLASETLQKLGIKLQPGRAASIYNFGGTTQLPGTFVANTGQRRISRQITVGGRRLKYENNYGRSETGA